MNRAWTLALCALLVISGCAGDGLTEDSESQSEAQSTEASFDVAFKLTARREPWCGVVGWMIDRYKKNYEIDVIASLLYDQSYAKRVRKQHEIVAINCAVSSAILESTSLRPDCDENSPEPVGKLEIRRNSWWEVRATLELTNVYETEAIVDPSASITPAGQTVHDEPAGYFRSITFKGSAHVPDADHFLRVQMGYDQMSYLTGLHVNSQFFPFDEPQ